MSILLPNLVAFFCYTVNFHLEKWLMRCDTNRAIWSDLYNKHIIIYLYMTSYVYIILIMIDSCMIWFHFDCIK